MQGGCTRQILKNTLTRSSTLTTLHRILGGRLNIGKYSSSCWCVEASSYKRNHEQFEEKKPQMHVHTEAPQNTRLIKPVNTCSIWPWGK
jgi:hypothetical protein